MRSISIVVASVSLSLIVGCSNDKSSSSSGGDAAVQPTGAGIVSSDDAAKRITEMRCAREERCSNIGERREYPNRDACVAAIAAKTRDALKPSDCPAGIAQTKLDSCVGAIQGESCGNPLDTLERLAACRSGELCPGKL